MNYLHDGGVRDVSQVRDSDEIRINLAKISNHDKVIPTNVS